MILRVVAPAGTDAHNAAANRRPRGLLLMLISCGLLARCGLCPSALKLSVCCDLRRDHRRRVPTRLPASTNILERAPTQHKDCQIQMGYCPHSVPIGNAYGPVGFQHFDNAGVPLRVGLYPTAALRKWTSHWSRLRYNSA